MIHMHRTKRSAFFAFLFSIAAATAAIAQSPTEYRISFPAPEHHYAEVEVTFTSAPATLEARMSRSSPGRYAIHEYAKNVFEVRGRRRQGQGPADHAARIPTSGT